MKKKIIISLVVVALVIILIGILLIFTEPPYEGKIKSFHFGSGSWTYMNYDLKKEDGKIIFKAEGVGEKPNQVEKEVDEEILNKLEDIINTNKVNKWDGFNKTDKNVMDGESFNLTITYEDGKVVNASGYMIFPKRYNTVSREIDKLFSPLLTE